MEGLSEESGETSGEEGEAVPDCVLSSAIRDAGADPREDQVETRAEEVGDQVGESSDEDEEYEIARLVAYHPDFGFRARWSDFTAEYGTLEKAKTLPLSAVAAYFGRIRKPIPREIQRLQSVTALGRR